MGNASTLVAMLAAFCMVGGGACSSSGQGTGEAAGPPESGEMADPGLRSTDLGPDSAAAGGGGSTPLTGLTGDAETGAPVDAPLSPETVPGEGTASDPAAPSLDGDIRFSEPSGTFEGSLSVGISSALDGADIRYTVDGSEPGPTSPRYDGNPVNVDRTRQIRARAFVGGEPAGDPGTALYVARTFDMVSDLPLVIVEGYGQGKPEDREIYVDMAFMVFEPVAGVAALSNPPTLVTRGGYHLRGQSSATFEQAPYRVELWDNASEDAEYPLLGMPPEADWALIGPYSDRTFIRNAFVYDLGRDMGLSAPRFAFAEVYINQADRALSSDDYQGIYMVVETIKNDKSRLDLKQLDEDDVGADVISGGYIFKFEWAASEEPTLECSGSEPLGGGFGFGGGMMGQGPGGAGASGTCWTDLEVVDPEPLVPAQADYLTGIVQQLHDALHSATFTEASALVNVRSFVDTFIVNELTRNLDAYTRSAYYYKERGAPITAGPLWDFNLTLGMGFGNNLNPVGWQFEERNVASDWFRILGSDPAFLAQVATRWQELRQTLLSQERLEQRIAALAAPLESASVRDFARWPVADVAEQGFFQLPSEPTWAGQLEVMRDWLGERLAWLDSQLL